MAKMGCYWAQNPIFASVPLSFHRLANKAMSAKKTVQVHDKYFETYLGQAQIRQRIAELAQAIRQDYADKNPLFIGILNGAFMFAAELFQQLDGLPCEIEFVKLKSYQGTASSGEVSVDLMGLVNSLEGRHVIILEDIIDTGRSMAALLPRLQSRNPASLVLSCLLHKPEVSQNRVPIQYLGFDIPNKFVVGWGLDYDGQGRDLDAIYALKTED